MKKLFFGLIFILGFSCFCFAESLAPENRKQIEINQSTVVIKCDVSDADVYINEIYQGRTDLTVINLLPGLYNLKIKKQGYENFTATFMVERGFENVFSIKMQKILGKVKVQNVVEESLISISNQENSCSVTGNHDDYEIEIAPGSYNFVVKKFGYEDYCTTVDVEAYQTTEVFVEMKEVIFELSNFYVSKKRFNPAFSGNLGKCEICFDVNKSEPVEIVICNGEGEEVWRKNLQKFYTWKQSVLWNGTDKNDEKLPDGKYSVSILGGGFSFSDDVILDSQISFPVFDYTKAGGGIGNLPMALEESHAAKMIVVQGGINFPLTEGEACAGTVINFSNHYEFSFGAGLVFGKDNAIPVQINSSLKVYDSVNLEKSVFNFAGLLRYGFSFGKIVDFSGVDVGNGLGVGGLFSFDFDNVFLGYESQVILGASDGIANFTDCVLSNGVAFSYKIKPFTKISLFCSLNSVLGGNFINCVNGGLGIDFMPESAGFIIGLLGDYTYISNYDNFYSCKIALSYLF